MAKAYKNIAKLVSLLTLAIFICIILTAYFLLERDKLIYPSNFKVAGISIANISEAQLAKLLNEELPEKLSKNIELESGNKIITLSLEEYGIRYNADKTMKKINNITRESDFTFFKSLLNRGSILNITPVYEYEKDLLHNKLLALHMDLKDTKSNAAVFYNNEEDKLVYIPQKNSLIIDVTQNYIRITDALDKGQIGPIKLLAEENEPEITNQDVEKITDLLGVALISIDDNKTELILELDRITVLLDGVIIMPDNSFNSAELFNTTQNLDANTKEIINEVLGRVARDAGVYTITKPDEIIIKNNFLTPIMIATYRENELLFVKIYGEQTDINREIALHVESEKILSEVILNNPNLQAQKKTLVSSSDNILKVSIYKVISQEQEILDKTLLAEKYYKNGQLIFLLGGRHLEK